MNYQNVKSSIAGIVLYGFLFIAYPVFSSTEGSSDVSTEYHSKLRIHGSNTIGEKFAPELIKEFLHQENFFITNTDTLQPRIERHIFSRRGLKGEQLEIELYAHGSSTGFKDLLALKTDIAMSSRRIKAKEVRNIARIYPSIVDKKSEHIIAYDALAIIVNSQSSISSLSLQQLAKIFSGEIKNWRELGGKDMAIKVFSRDDNSGTYDTFKSLVLKPFELKLSPQSLRFESSSSLVDNIKNSDGAIGFIGISHTADNKVLAISTNGLGNGILPDRHTIGTEDYPLSRKLYLYLPLEIENPIAHKFVNYVESNAGQSLASRSQLISFFPTKSRPLLKNKSLESEFKNLRTFGQRLSVTFRLSDGQLDAKSDRDIQRLVSYYLQNPYQKIVLAGFWDDPEFDINSQNEIQRWMDILKKQLLKNSLKPWIVKAGFLPIENNLIDSGRVINRRIEVWVL